MNPARAEKRVCIDTWGWAGAGLRGLNPMRNKPIRETVETLTRVLRSRTTALAAMLLFGLFPAAGRGAPLDARVIWSQGDRIYVVVREPIRTPLGSTLFFYDRSKEVASGTVIVIPDSTMIVARITAGSVARVKHLERLRVEAVSAPGSFLRVGYPSDARVQPFFKCLRLVLDTRAYRADTLNDRTFQLVRFEANNLPDTLLIRMFGDAADEEIALERGELDAAIFWPGEASSHIREVMRWPGAPNVLRTRGVVANYETPGMRVLPEMYEADRTRVDSVNTEMFRGDLKPASHIRFVSEHPPIPSRFEVDSACPGKRSIEAFLNRGRAPGRGILRFVTYLDEPTDPNLVEESRGRLFLISCPVLSRPELLPYLDTIDLSAIVNLFDCETAARKP